MQVLVVSPPNSNTVIDGMSCTVTRPEEHTDWSDFPNLGVLTLASALNAIPSVDPVYVDGTVVPWPEVRAYVEDNANDILALCISALTATYEAGLDLCAAAKRVNGDIVTVVGNDHVTALTYECLSARPDILDYAFVGNEVVRSFVGFITALSAGEPVRDRDFPGLAWLDGSDIRTCPQRPEPIHTEIDYSMIDRAFDHSSLYQVNFESRIVPTFKKLTGRLVRAGMPIEIGRGCIKFARNDACSFCSIQYGGMWRNSVSDPDSAWRLVREAHGAGYDYLYLTADELPLTFGKLLRGMVASPPGWWADLPEVEKPVMVGYARADGLSDERHALNLRQLGVRQLMVGLDAGTATSLHAMRKPLAPVRDPSSSFRAEKMFDHNVRALRSAKNNDLLLKVGFVIGHVGMDARLLRDNVDSMKALLDSESGSVSSLDVEVLSPEPGSLDFSMLLDPDLARSRAAELKLPMPSRAGHEARARKWRGTDVIDREEAMSDYIESVMPGLTFDDLAAARAEVREHGRRIGVTIGD